MEQRILSKPKVAEVELKYRTNVNPQERAQIKSSESAFRIFLDSWNKNTIEYFEEFKVLLLNRNNRVLGLTTLTKGSTTGTIVDVKLLLQYALKTNASAIIVAHNHPSGNLKPSEADKAITKKIVAGCEAIDIKLLDHLIIVHEGGFFSFADETCI